MVKGWVFPYDMLLTTEENTAPLLNIVRGPTNAAQQGKHTECTQVRKSKTALFTDDTITYLENSKELTKKAIKTSKWP